MSGWNTVRKKVWMDNIHVEVMSDDLKPAPAKPIYASRLSPPAKGSTGDARAAAWRQQCIYPNGGGLVQYGLNPVARDGSATGRASQVLVSRQMPL